jgi:hypothetical protein
MLRSLQLLRALAGLETCNGVDIKRTHALIQAAARLKEISDGPSGPSDGYKHQSNNPLPWIGCGSNSQPSSQWEIPLLATTSSIVNASKNTPIAQLCGTDLRPDSLPEYWPRQLLKCCHGYVLDVLHQVAMAHSPTCAFISRYLLKGIGKYVDLREPGPNSALVWNILASHAKVSPEATGVLLAHVHRYLRMFRLPEKQNKLPQS